MSTAIREELAHHEVTDVVERRAEAAALCRFAGALHLAGGSGRRSWVVTTRSGAVARRLRRTLVDDLGIRPSIEVHRPAGLRAVSEYRLSFPLSAGAHDALGLLDDRGAPRPEPPTLTGPVARRGWIRGAALATLAVSAPGRAAHLELGAPNGLLADHLAGLLRGFGAPGARSNRRGTAGPGRYRVVVKSGEELGAVLAGLGAHHAFLERDLRRLERGLRSDANRAANADRANLDRAATAAARQVADIHDALQRCDPADLPAEVRATALARLANPESSLGEVGALLDPPVARGTVHRRIARLLSLAEEGSPER
jgi:cell division protein WhiA